MGQRHYEQKDHLGNVVATISDRRIAVDQYNYTTGTTHVASTVINTVDPTRPAYVYVGTGGTKAFALGTDNMADGWMPEVETYSDYYPFGALMPGRYGNPEQYRYAFNSQEKVDEIKNGPGTHYTAPYWEMDPRLGRRWNIDPVVKPHQSGYSILGNSPIVLTDPLGNTEDWYEDDKGNVRWFNNDAKEVYAAPTEEGKEYSQWRNIGKELRILTQSYIDKDNDIPAPMPAPDVAGLKFQTYIVIGAAYDENGNFDGFTGSFKEEVGFTFNYFRGANPWGTITPPHKVGDTWQGGIWRHTEVAFKEKPFLSLIGGSIVDVNQKIDFTVDAHGYLNVNIGHGTFPSLTFDILNTARTEYQFLEHSFVKSHGSGDWMNAHAVIGTIRQAFSYQKNDYFIKSANLPFIHFTGYTAGYGSLLSYPHLPKMPWEN